MKEWFLLTLGAILCWGGWAFLPKLSVEYMSAKSILIYEGLGVAIISLLIFSHLNYSLETNLKGAILAIIAGMLNCLGVLFYIKAISKGSVSIISTLSAFYPLVVVILASFILKETLTLKQMIGIGLALVSITLITT